VATQPKPDYLQASDARDLETSFRVSLGLLREGPKDSAQSIVMAGIKLRSETEPERTLVITVVGEVATKEVLAVMEVLMDRWDKESA
jgi:hypothetical protein